MTRRWRGRLSADLVIVLLLFAALVAFTAYTTARRAESSPAPAYSTHSTALSGAAALYLWLDELGYRVDRIEGNAFAIDDDTDLLFVLSPYNSYTGPEMRLLETWAEGAGHTLVLATEGWQLQTPLRDFGVGLIPRVELAEVLTPTVPLLTSPPPGPVAARADRVLRLSRDDYVAHLQHGDDPVLVSLRWGEGRVFLAATVRPFTNAGLRDPGSARLVYNLLAGLEPGARVQFDEWHHGYATEQAVDNTLLAWLYRSPWGWALLFAAAVTLGWIVLRGRRFGRPVPLPEQVRRRPQSEYVVSMAGLFRRAGRRSFVMQHHHDRLKRELARPWRLNPDLPDEAFVAELARYRDNLDEPALRDLLARLTGERVSEADLVRLVGEVETWLLGVRQ